MELKHLTALLIIPALSIGLWGCDVEETEEGRLPSIEVEGDTGEIPKWEVEVEKTQEGRAPDIDKVEVDTGEMPEYDVTTPEVEVREKTIEMTVPDVNVVPADEVDDNDADATIDD